MRHQIPKLQNENQPYLVNLKTESSYFILFYFILKTLVSGTLLSYE